MKVVPDSDAKLLKPVYYIPHHGVIRENSITTKLRVIFNASSRTSSGVSLNDILHTGAKLQTELIDVLIRFRQFKYVFKFDIEKMYRQVKVHPDDWNLQRILWNKDQNKTLTFQLTTVTYGLACAPFLALRIMQQLIVDEGSKFPLAIDVLRKGRYVDDIFGGADSIEESQKTVQQVNDICMAGGLPLRKWTSNEPRILERIPSANLRTEQPSGLETGDVRLELSRALALWSENSKLTFQEVNSDRADILVFFHRGYHGDGYPFDGRGKILAHAFFPGGDRGGDAHFDEEEIWLLNGDDSNEEGTSLFAVAAHEFGHSLGLSHSSVRGALMYPWYQGITSNYKLPEDDRNGIQQMYGAPENKLWAYLPVNPRPRRPTPTTTTTPRITTTTYRPWKTRPTWSHYPNYYPDEDRPKRPPDRYPHYRTERPDYRPQDRYPTKPDIRTERPDYRPLPPKRPHVHHHTTSTTTTTTTTTTSTSHRPRHRWTPQVNENIPDKCDTSYDAISIIRREVFIFKGRYLWRIGDQGLYEGFPAEISRLFNVPKDTDHVDAVYERLDKKIVFFIGKFYYVFSANILESGYPKPLTTLGLPASLKKIDGAMVWGHNKRTYFFSGTMYWRLDETTNSVELDYPRDMSMFAGVGYNIDAVFQWKNGKTYFFKGKYFWEFDDVRMRVSHEKAKLSSTFWMNCSSEVDTNDIDEIPRRRTHWKISSSSASKISSSSLIILVLISTLLSRALTIRITL